MSEARLLNSTSKSQFKYYLDLANKTRKKERKAISTRTSANWLGGGFFPCFLSLMGTTKPSLINKTNIAIAKKSGT